MSDSLIESTLKSAEASKFAWPLADLARGFLHSSLQAPLEGGTQLLNQLSSGNLKAPEIVKAPEPAPFLSASYNLQQVGGALGMMIPFGATSKFLRSIELFTETGLLAKGLKWGGTFGKAGLTHLGLAASIPLLELPAAKLALPVAQAACSGFAYDFAFHKVKEGPNFWQDRFTNGLSGAATFGTLEFGKTGLRFFNDYSPFSSEMRRHFWSGLAAGTVDAETRSLLAGNGLIWDKQLFESVYNFTVIGGALGAYETYRQSKIKPGSKQQTSSAETQASTPAEKIEPASPASSEVADTKQPSSNTVSAAEKQALKLAKREARRQKTQERRTEEHAALVEAEKLRQESAQQRKQQQREHEQLRQQQKVEQELQLQRTAAEARKLREEARLKQASDKAAAERLSEQNKLDTWKESCRAKQPAEIWKEYKQALTAAESSGKPTRGDKAQNELYSWSLKEHVFSGQEHPAIADLLRLRQSVQQQMQGGGWELVETNKHSIADRAGMDYLLVNHRDGRYFFLDATLSGKSKKNLPLLRQENVVELSLQGDANLNQPTIESRRDFLQLLQERMQQSSDLNLQDVPPPNLSNKLNLEQSIAELNRFRRDIDTKCQYLELEAKLLETDSPAHAADLRRRQNKLSAYNADLNRVETFVRMKDQQLNDPSWAIENTAYEWRVKKTLSRMLSDVFAGKKISTTHLDTSSGDVVVIDAQRRKFVFNEDADALHFYERPERARYELSGIKSLLQQAISQAASTSTGKGDAFALKRQLLSASTAERYGLITNLLELLSRVPSKDLLGRQ